MTKRLMIIFALMISLTIASIISCDKCGDNKLYKVVDLYVEITGAQYNAQDPVKVSYFNISNDSIYYSFFGIFIHPDLEAYAHHGEKPHYFSLIHNAYACDPQTATTEDHITNIEIIANQDYDESHPQGSNLADYFDIVVTYRHTNTINEIYSLQQYLARKPLVPDEMVLILNTKPKQDSKLTFTLKYYQEGVSFDSKVVTFDEITILQ